MQLQQLLDETRRFVERTRLMLGTFSTRLDVLLHLLVTDLGKTSRGPLPSTVGSSMSTRFVKTCPDFTNAVAFTLLTRKFLFRTMSINA